MTASIEVKVVWGRAGPAKSAAQQHLSTVTTQPTHTLGGWLDMGDRSRDSTAQIQRARKLVDEGSCEEAISILSRAVFADPSNAELFRVSAAHCVQATPPLPLSPSPTSPWLG
jgi:Tfp pilus assembly protein PilF